MARPTDDFLDVERESWWDPYIEEQEAKTGLIMQSRLKQRPGWTNAAIGRFLGKPDQTKENPRYRTKGAPMRFYAISRVEDVEKTEEFIAWKAKSQRRSEIARQVAERKAQDLLAELSSWKPTLRIPEGDLVSLAIKSYEARHHWMRDGESNDPAFISRIVGNYLRHECSDYEVKLTSIKRRVGSSDAYETIKALVTEKTDEAIKKYLAATERGG